MLHNSGPYGPNEVPINMGVPVNMSQMTPTGNLGHSLNNLGKIAQPPVQTTSPYNLPDYSSYGHPPLGMGAQMSPFQSYNPIGYQPNYFSQNPPSIHDNSWQNGMLPMNLNTQINHSSSMLNYPVTFDKRPLNPVNSHYKEDCINRRNIPLNIPQVPTKAFQKVDSDDIYGLYNVNHDKFNHYHPISDLNVKQTDKPLLDNTRRKSLENTVRLIEDILINTTKNRDLQQQQESMHKMHQILNKPAEKSNTYPLELQKTDKQVDSSLTEPLIKPPNTSNLIDMFQKPLITALKHDIELEIKEKNIQDTITTPNSTDLENSSDSFVDKINDSTEHKSDMKYEDEITETEDSSSESEAENVKERKAIESVEIKMELDDTSVVVKVESLCWTDTDYFNPFHRDMNGVTRDDAVNRIVDPEDSINQAVSAIKNAAPPDLHYECPNCGILFSHPKRFLVHIKWHSFGLTNDKRMEVARERETRRNLRKEARVVDRMNSKEVSSSSSSKKVYPCKECDKAFSSKGSLKNHRQRFHPTRIRECKICRKTVLGWMALRAHLTTHTNESGFKCQDCPKQFKYAHSLAKHRDTHLEKTLGCHQCPKMFGSNAQLKMHQKVHERAQRGATYSCSYCAKAFYESYNLSVHERTHRNERPFLCEICNTSFGTNSSLKRHLKVSHNSAKPYECDTCHRSFVTETIRDRHAMRQHGDPERFQFACEECNCRYLKSKDLQKHMYKAHPKGKRKKKVKSDSE